MAASARIQSTLAGRRALVLALLLSGPVHAAEPVVTLAAHELLAKLRARDEQFDNVHLVYLMRGTMVIEDYSWKFMDMEDARPAFTPPQNVKYVYRDELVVRGADVTHSRKVIEPTKENQAVQLMRYNKTSNIKGIRTELSLEDAGSNLGFVTVTDRGGAGFGSEAYLRMIVEFSLGFGYGRRMTEIKTLKTSDAGVSLQGAIRVGRDEAVPCSLELDNDLIVRRAVIDLPRRRYNVTTRDHQERDGFLFAASGRMQMSDDESRDDYFIIFQDAQFKLSDERYRELTRIEVPAGVDVVHTGRGLEDELAPAAPAGK